MKINFNNQNFMGREFVTKEISGMLKDASTAHVKITYDNSFNLTTLDCLVLKDGKIKGRKNYNNFYGLSKEDTAHFFETLQQQAKEGVDFLREFGKALIS